MVTLSLIDPQTNQPLKDWNFPNHSLIRIGRHPDNDLVFGEYPQVSKHHAELRVLENIPKLGWELVSYGTNGTFVNGSSITQTSLKDDDLIRFSPNGPLVKFQVSSFAPCLHLNNPPKSLFCMQCGQPIVEKEEFIRDFQILRTLGQGGMGTTYLAWDKSGNLSGIPKLIVLKEMNADMAAIAKARELFEREARILQSLNHSGIPKFYDFFVHERKKYLAMELIHGDNLEHRVYHKGPVTPVQAIKWMIELCDILSYLHSLNPPLVHRDVKPANLLVKNVDKRILLIDFGAVKEIGTPAGTRIGAEGYSAPEQNLGKPCPQSDLYAIGPTLIFLLTGSSPSKYQGPLSFESNFDLTKVPTISPPLAKVINKASRIKVRERYQTAQELAEALARCL